VRVQTPASEDTLDVDVTTLVPPCVDPPGVFFSDCLEMDMFWYTCLPVVVQSPALHFVGVGLGTGVVETWRYVVRPFIPGFQATVQT